MTDEDSFRKESERFPPFIRDRERFMVQMVANMPECTASEITETGYYWHFDPGLKTWCIVEISDGRRTNNKWQVFWHGSDLGYELNSLPGQFIGPLSEPRRG